jgi:putative protease
MAGIRIGKVTHFFDKINVAVLDLTDTIRVGETLHFLGHSTDFKQKVESLQIEHQAVNEAGPKKEVATKVIQTVHPNDAVFRLTDEE